MHLETVKNARGISQFADGKHWEMSGWLEQIILSPPQWETGSVDNLLMNIDLHHPAASVTVAVI